eukprot:jgi/Botrbrau1/21890/Bobra.0249s0019.1
MELWGGGGDVDNLPFQLPGGYGDLTSQVQTPFSSAICCDDAQRMQTRVLSTNTGMSV